MIKCVFDRASGVYVGGARNAAPDHDTATQVLVELPDFPDRKTQRWDGATGVRTATAQEQTDFEEAESERLAMAEIDQRAVLKAVVAWVADLHDLTPKQARDAVVAKYKALRQ